MILVETYLENSTRPSPILQLSLLEIGSELRFHTAEGVADWRISCFIPNIGLKSYINISIVNFSLSKKQFSLKINCWKFNLLFLCHHDRIYCNATAAFVYLLPFLFFFVGELFWKGNCSIQKSAFFSFFSNCPWCTEFKSAEFVTCVLHKSIAAVFRKPEMVSSNPATDQFFSRLFRYWLTRSYAVTIKIRGFPTKI